MPRALVSIVTEEDLSLHGAAAKGLLPLLCPSLKRKGRRGVRVAPHALDPLDADRYALKPADERLEVTQVRHKIVAPPATTGQDSVAKENAFARDGVKLRCSPRCGRLWQEGDSTAKRVKRLLKVA